MRSPICRPFCGVTRYCRCVNDPMVVLPRAPGALCPFLLLGSVPGSPASFPGDVPCRSLCSYIAVYLYLLPPAQPGVMLVGSPASCHRSVALCNAMRSPIHRSFSLRSDVLLPLCECPDGWSTAAPAWRAPLFTPPWAAEPLWPGGAAPLCFLVPCFSHKGFACICSLPPDPVLC